VERAFAQMRERGANVVRVHLQLARFMDAPDAPNAEALERLGQLVALAEREQLYLDVTGVASYRRSDEPPWYAAATEETRWATQARFWEAVSERVGPSAAVFCYDLMNEPAVPGPGREADWLAEPWVNGRTYVQRLTRDLRGRPRWEVGRAWLRRMTRAIRAHDARHLITVGTFLIGEQAEQLPIGATPSQLAQEVDFLSVHLYPQEGALEQSLTELRALNVGKPVLVEETAPLRCSVETYGDFIRRSKQLAAGWLGFFWGDPRQNPLMAGSLEVFARGPP
jgi:hypothetical protein